MRIALFSALVAVTVSLMSCGGGAGSGQGGGEPPVSDVETPDVTTGALGYEELMTRTIGDLGEYWSATLPEERLALLWQIGFGEVREQGVGSPVAPILIRTLVRDRPMSDWLLAGRRLADLEDWDLRMLYSMHG